jgi:DNA segregation ATPase FtsK/SpoIIIE-like protein
VTASSEDVNQPSAHVQDGASVDSEPGSKASEDDRGSTDLPREDQTPDEPVNVPGEKGLFTSDSNSPVEDTSNETSGPSESEPTECEEESEKEPAPVEDDSPAINIDGDTKTEADGIHDTKQSSQVKTPSDADGSTVQNPIGVNDSASTQLLSIFKRLQESPEPETKIDTGALASNLREGFESLGVEVYPPNPSSITIGPRKVGVNVLPKQGQKVEGILKSLNSLSVHIQAHGNIVGKPMPSEGAVRIEIPHNNPQDIYLREGLEALVGEVSAPLMIPLGVNTERKHRALSLPEERHVLIAGTPGSGKSNFLATVISTLAVINDPSQVKITLLDPKGLDFGKFQTLPHVETYQDTANGCVEKLLELVRDELPERREALQNVGASSVAELNENANELDVKPIPYHVVVIDEYADLIMSAEDQDDFESAVTRLAQVGRALGLIILLATQRPSADIVSGKIKANFPCRISFKLPSNTDSRVILDKTGAEDLQGAGDMIALTQSGDEYHLQAYRLILKDIQTILELAENDKL